MILIFWFAVRWKELGHHHDLYCEVAPVSCLRSKRWLIVLIAMEFLIGRSLANNLTNLMLAPAISDYEWSKGIKISELFEQEPDAPRRQSSSSLGKCILTAAYPRQCNPSATPVGKSLLLPQDAIGTLADSLTNKLNMLRPTQIAIPTLVRVKDRALDRLGIYLRRHGRQKVAVLTSKGLQPPPKLHGLQVGVASYLISILQQENTERIASLFDATGFWEVIAVDPFSRSEWLEAVRLAPSMKPGFYTVPSSRDVLPRVELTFKNDRHLTRCFH